MARRPAQKRAGRSARDSMVVSAKQLGRALVSDGVITEDQRLQAFEYQSQHGGSLKDAVLKLGFATEDDLIGAIISNQDLGVSYMGLAGYEVEADVLATVPSEFAFRNKLIPVSRAGKTLTVAMADPLDMVVINDLRSTTKCSIVPAIAREAEIEEALRSHYQEAIQAAARQAAAGAPAARPGDVMAEVTQQYAEELASAQVIDVADGVDEDSAPIIRLSSKLIDDAYEKRASDIHIEPFESETIIRFRIDGVLHVIMRLPLGAMRALVARYKIMSDLDIAEHRMPQDGRIAFKNYSRKGTDLDLRVSVIPVAFGEKIVMRLLDKQSAIIGLDSMGFSDENLAAYRTAIKQPYGMVLHVGPTGSGKTTTLYAALAEINSPELNIQTAEDPVEYMLKGINQCQMHHDIGFDFAKALRAFLRQDPDVIMVGEIRDLETAMIGIEAALTGHLLFSTLHTNDAVGTVVRLIEMGIEPFLVSSSLLLVCAQRLMRRLCRCKQPDAPDEGETNTLVQHGFDTDEVKIHRPRGCGECSNTGYRGRTGTHEMLAMTPELHELTNKRAADEDLRNAAVRGGMVPIYRDAISKAASGVTSFEEAVRVVRER
ncbi:MAG: GspE/PulE family protein [Planctomycetota bacterium]